MGSLQLNMHYHIKDILKFIRLYDTSGIYKDQSNTKLRQYIRACLEKNSFYFVHIKGKLIGLVEWYRIKNCRYLVDRIRNKKFLNTNPSGKIIYVHNAVFKPSNLTMKIYKAFSRFHSNITQIIWFRHKTKKFTSIKV